MTIDAVNPWQRLPHEGEFVLPEDAEAISAFNSKAPDEFRVHLELQPEPYLGNPKAPIVVLGLNPGFDVQDPDYHKQQSFSDRVRLNLFHEPAEWPLFYVNWTDGSPGGRWWRDKLRDLWQSIAIPKSADSMRVVASCVFAVEFFPYHSRNFNHRELRSVAQPYSFGLVRQAVER